MSDTVKSRFSWRILIQKIRKYCCCIPTDECDLDGATIVETRSDGATIVETRSDGATIVETRSDGATIVETRSDGATIVDISSHMVEDYIPSILPKATILHKLVIQDDESKKYK